MNTTEREYLSAADTAKLIRQALKANFPGHKFSVRSSVYAGGASIRISYIDGPRLAQVHAVTDRFQGSDFDGMIDLKTSREDTLLAGPNGELRAVHFGADYVFVDRDYSVPTYLAAASTVALYWGKPVPTENDLYIHEGRADGLRADPWMNDYDHRTLGQLIRAELERDPEASQ